jgi:pimeloyl-ACP methyl ester carboxylesterase
MRSINGLSIAAIAATVLTVSLVAVPVAPAGAGGETATIAWSPCRELPDADCGTLPVPLDWSRPHGPKVELAVARRRATDPSARIGSLFVNPGGPGGSGRDFALSGGLFTDEVRRHFDIVGFDPRGVGLSEPVRCSVEAVETYPRVFPATRAAFDRQVADNRRLRQDCRRHTGPVFDHVDSLTGVYDMDAMRAAVGDRRLTYYGLSYGTMVAQQYAEVFPDRVRAIVADSNMDHSLDVGAFVETEAASAQGAFDEFVAWCDRTASCALHSRDVRAVWHDLLARAERGELPSPFDPARPLPPEDLTVIAYIWLFGPNWFDLAEILAALDSGAPIPDEVAAALTARRASELTEFPVTAVFCDDWDVQVRDFGELARLAERSRQAAPDMRYSPDAAEVVTACQGYPRRVANPQHRLRVRDAATPLLLLNARHDPATGYNWAVNVARQLGPQAVLLTYDGWGHGVYLRSECTTAPVDRYLISQVLPARGTHCPAVEPQPQEPQRLYTRSVPGPHYKGLPQALAP